MCELTATTVCFQSHRNEVQSLCIATYISRTRCYVLVKEPLHAVRFSLQWPVLAAVRQWRGSGHVSTADYTENLTACSGFCIRVVFSIFEIVASTTSMLQPTLF